MTMVAKIIISTSQLIPFIKLISFRQLKIEMFVSNGEQSAVVKFFWRVVPIEVFFIHLDGVLLRETLHVEFPGMEVEQDEGVLLGDFLVVSQMEIHLPLGQSVLLGVPPANNRLQLFDHKDSLGSPEHGIPNRKVREQTFELLVCQKLGLVFEEVFEHHVEGLLVEVVDEELAVVEQLSVEELIFEVFEEVVEVLVERVVHFHYVGKVFRAKAQTVDEIRALPSDHWGGLGHVDELNHLDYFQGLGHKLLFVLKALLVFLQELHEMAFVQYFVLVEEHCEDDFLHN